jgi:3-phosphoshikimate 1-carboxyvinyltransferase
VGRLVVRPVSSLNGECTVPGDKSVSHRALILASQATGESTIAGLSGGEDVRDTYRVLRSLGVTAGEWGDDPLPVTGVGPGGWKEPEGVLDFGNSGTGIRLMAGMLAAHPFFCVLTGDRYLRRRPMMRVVEPLRLMGASIDGRQEGRFPPLAVRGGGLTAKAYRTPVASAQVKSALLLAGLLAEGATELTEPALSRDHTERMLRYLGVRAASSGTTVRLQGGQSWEGRDFAVPGDPSSAAFLLAAGLIVPGSQVTVRGVCVNPTRTGFFEVVRAMGGDISFSNETEAGGEPVADVTARSSALRGLDVPPEVVPRAIDEFPILAVLALFAAGRTVISGAAELRVKESDRIRTMASELGRLGGSITEMPDGLAIEGGGLRGAVCRSHGDHRVAMALAVAGCALPGDTVIEDTACVKTSFPEFRNLMNSLGADTSEAESPSSRNP